MFWILDIDFRCIFFTKVSFFWDLSQNMSLSSFLPKYRPLIGRPGIDVFWRESTWTHFLTLISKITDFSWAWYQEKPDDLAHYCSVWLKAAWVCLNSKYSSVLYWNMTWNSPKFESPWWHTSNLPKHWPTRWSYLLILIWY